MKESTVVSRYPNCYVEVIHRAVNPTVWVVNRSKKVLWFKRRLASSWFISEKQAYGFAEKLKHEHERQRSTERAHEQV